MAFKDQVVELVLRAKNMLSRETDAAATSVEKLAGNAGGLQEKLRSLEDQATLITQFDKSSKAVDRTSAAYDKAQLRLDKLADKFGQTGPLTERQAQEFAIAGEAVEVASRNYDQAKKSLDGLAKEAEAAGIDVTDLAGAQRENQKQTVSATRALEDYNDELDEGGSRLTKLGNTLAVGAGKLAAWASAAAAATAALAFTALTRFTKESADLADQLTNTSLQLGISTTKLQEFSAASRTVGVEQGQLTSIFKDMTKNIGEAANGGGRFAPILKRINVEIEDLIGLSPDEQLLKIADAISGLSNEEQVNVLERMGSGASKLLPLLQGNASELERIVQAARDRGAIMSEEEVQRLVQVQDTLNRINERMEGLRNRVVAAVAPAFEDLADVIDRAFDTESGQKFLGFLEGMSRKLIEFVRDTTADMGSLESSVQSVVDTFQFLGNGMVAIFRGVQSFAAGSLEVLARVAYSAQNLVVGITRGLNKIGLATDETLAAAEFKLQNLGATVQDLEAKSAAYKKQAIEAGKAALTAFDNTESAANRAGAATNMAAGELYDLSDALQDIEKSSDGAIKTAEDYAKAQADLKKRLAETAAAIELANQRWSEDPTDENISRIEALKKEYRELQEIMNGLKPPAPDEGDEGDPLVQQLQNVRDSADEVTDATGRTWRQFVTLGEEIDTVGDKSEEAGKKAESSAGRVGASLSGVVSGWLGHMADLSIAAQMAFKRALGDTGAGQAVGELEGRLAAVTNRIDDMNGRLRSGGGVGKVLRDWARAGFEVEQSFLEQSIAVRDLTESILEGDRAASVLGKSAAEIEQQFDLLDKHQLSGLQAAVAAVRNEVDSLSDSLRDTIASLEQEAAALRGDTAEVERLRYLEKEAELREQLNYAEALGDREAIESAQRALELSKQNFEIRRNQAELQDAERRKAAADKAAADAEARQLHEQEERQDISRQATQARATQAQTQSIRTVRLQFTSPQGRNLGDLDVVDDTSVDQLLDALERGGYLAAR